MHHILINPTAGHGRAARVGEQVIETIRRQNMLHGISRTEAEGHAALLARKAAEEGAGTVIVVGGDGTVREATQGLQGTDAALGVIPAGTGNDAAKMLGLPQKPMDALRFIIDHPARPVDAGSVNGSLFFNVCGIGFDVCVLDYANRAKKFARGMLPYLWGVIRTIFTFKPVEATYSIDGAPPETCSTLIIAVANGRYFGGGLAIAPDSYPDDGLLDVVFVDTMPRRRMPFQVPKLVVGRVREIPGFSSRRCRKIEIAAPGLRMQIDGELLSTERAVIEIRERALLAHW